MYIRVEVGGKVLLKCAVENLGERWTSSLLTIFKISHIWSKTLVMIFSHKKITIITICSTLIWKKDGRMISAGRTIIRKDPRMSLVPTLDLWSLRPCAKFQQIYNLAWSWWPPTRWRQTWRSWRFDPRTRELISATSRPTGNPSTRLTPSTSLSHPLFRFKIFDSFILSQSRSSLQAQPSNGKFVVRAGSTITLECRAQGNPMPRVAWTRQVISIEHGH